MPGQVDTDSEGLLVSAKERIDRKKPNEILKHKIWVGCRIEDGKMGAVKESVAIVRARFKMAISRTRFRAVTILLKSFLQ